MNIMGMSLAGLQRTPVVDRVKDVASSLKEILRSIFNLHMDFFESVEHEGIPGVEYLSQAEKGLWRFKFKKAEPKVLYFQRICNKYFCNSVDYFFGKPKIGVDNLKALARAWACLGAGCLLLYVPHLPMDPAFLPILRKQFFVNTKDRYKQKLDDISQAEQKIFQIHDSIHCQSLQNIIDALEPEPYVRTVYRPANVDLTSLEDIYVLISELLGRFERNYFSNSDCVCDPVLLDRIQVLIERLSAPSNAYHDIKNPIIAFLSCLSLGCRLATNLNSDNLDTSCASSIIQQIPLLASNPKDWSLHSGTFKLKSNQQSRSKMILTLNSIALHMSLKQFTEHPAQIKDYTLHLYNQIYHHWRTVLIDEQEHEEKRGTELYHIRSKMPSNNDDTLNIKETLTYNDSGGLSKIESTEESSEELSVTLADVHRRMFGEEQSVEISLKSLINQAIKTIAQDSFQRLQTTFTEELNEGLYTLTLLHLNSVQRPKRSFIAQSYAYDFNIDSNLNEALKFQKLLRSIQLSVLNENKEQSQDGNGLEILGICHQALAVRINSPLSIFLQVSERLHFALDNWDKLRSKSLLSYTRGMAELICNWRKLEVQSWRTMLDAEDRKCSANAKRWWFVMYESIIIGTCRACEENNLKKYRMELVVILEDFLSSSSSGQFQQRLTMIKAFLKHLLLLAETRPTIFSTCDAIASLLDYFTRYEAGVRSFISNTRKGLARDLNEIVQIATLKDLDVKTLKESAYISWKRILRLKRTYQELLNQPANFSFKGHVPHDVTITRLEIPNLNVNLNPGYLRLADISIPGWDQRKEPYKDILSTVEAMSLILDMNSVVTQCTKNVTSVRLSLQNVFQDISRRVGEEHPKLSRCVRQRKRQLFNDVKRSLRKLGFGNRDERDTCISTLDILARLPSSPNVESGSEPLAREYFYGFLQEMPNIRRMQQEHAQNLAHFEVIRFTDHIESLLRFLTDQREGLLIVIKSFSNVESIILKLRPYIVGETFTAPKSVTSIVEYSSLRDKVKILPALIALSIDALHAQGQYAEFDVETIEVFMLEWRSNFQLAYEKTCNIPPVVYGFASETEKKMREDIEASLLQFVQDLRSWQQKYPALSHIIDKIILWTTYSFNVETESNPSNVSDIYSMSQNFFDLLDIMLGSIQDVKCCIAKAETSLGSNGWLQSVDKNTINILRAFRFNAIEEQLVGMLRHKIGNKQIHEDSALCINGLFKNLGPIIEQYRQISFSFISQYTDFHRAICHYSYFVATTFTEICSEEFWVGNEGYAGEAFSDEIKGDKVGLGDGIGAENANNATEDSKDITDLDHLEDRDDLADDMLEEDALELREDNELEGTRDNVAQNNAFEEDLDDQKQEIEEKIEQAGESARDKKLWDKSDMEEDSQATNGQGLSTGSAAAREAPESMNEPLQTHDKQELREQAKANVSPSDVETQRMDESIIMDDQEAANLADEYDTPIDQNDVMENKDLESASEDNLSTQSPSTSKIEEPIDVNNSPLYSDNLSETSSITDIGNGEENSPLPENSNSDQGNEESLNRYKNDYAEESGDLTVRPNVVESEINQQACRGQGIKGFGGAQTEQKKQQPLTDDQTSENDPDSDAYQGTGYVFDDLSSQENFNYQLTVWKSLGSEFEEWMASQVDTAQERSAEQQGLDIEIANMQQNASKDRFFKEQTSSKAENGITLGAQGGKEQSESKSITETLTEEPSYEDIVVPEQGNAVKKTPTSRETAQNASKYIQDTELSKNEDSKLLDKYEIENVKRDISTGRLRLSHSEELEEFAIDENMYQGLSQVLAEQLRLILEPTKATRFRGDFRTGKKLNIRRIIPYIASGGRKDKIWMRRTVPSKRAYQIMLALDDSKSMVESDSVSPALQSLALISKALAIVEAGELCVVAFGEDCRVVLDFGTPFTYETQNLLKKSFTFTQSRTDIRALIEATVSHFRKARSKASNSESHLWQLQLIISDGICEEHEAVRKLLYQAEQERIMIVFIIMDFGAQATEVGQDVLHKSILDLQTATFASDAQDNIIVKRQHYMDTFPFKWYLLVRNIKDLPFALTTALRQWFAEVTSYYN